MSDTLVFSDLDGTFLDHHDYGYGPALAVFESLRAQGIPVIWNTSKTLAEMLVFREPLNPDTPFVVENGAAVYLPEHALPLIDRSELRTVDTSTGLLFEKSFGMHLGELEPYMAQWHGRYAFRAFSEMSTEDVMDCTGLSEAQATLARQRGFSDPFLWQDSEEAARRFLDDLDSLGLRGVRGGRFLHVSGHHDKGQAMIWLRDGYALGRQNLPRCIALGDGHNDLPMLARADFAVVIPSATGQTLALPEELSGCVAPEPGPGGWAAVLGDMLVADRQN